MTHQEGISLALLPRGYPGLETGPRHDVLSIAFMNGTVKGKDVFIPMDMLIGGQERVCWEVDFALIAFAFVFAKPCFMCDCIFP